MAATQPGQQILPSVSDKHVASLFYIVNSLHFLYNMEVSDKPAGLEIKRQPTHQLYVDYVNILGGRVRTIEKNAEALLVARKETGLDVNADKTKYMVMSGDQNAGLNHNMKIDSKSFERAKVTIFGNNRNEYKFHSVRN